MKNNELELNKYRGLMYRLLSSIYIKEIDVQMLDALMKMELPEFNGTEGWQQDIAGGFKMVKDYLAAFDGRTEAEKKDLLEDLAADYAKTFLAAGDASGKAAFPYESVYTGTDSAFGGSVQMNLAALYAAKGLKMKEDMFKIMEDHIGLEFNYMAEILSNNEEAKAFFKDHLEKWTSAFANDVYKYSERDFYKGFARVTLGFIGAERAYFKG